MKRAEPVTFVRSPMWMKVASVSLVAEASSAALRTAAHAAANGSSPDSRSVGFDLRDLARRRCRATASAIARMCAGVVPQQPPTMLTRPACAHSRSWRADDLRPLLVLAELVRQAGVGIGGDQRVGDRRELGQERPHQLGAEARS